MNKEPYKNKDLDIEERVEDLLSRMTIREKIGQLIGILPQFVIDDDGNADYQALDQYKDGLGRISQFTRAGEPIGVEKIPHVYNQIGRAHV